MNPGLNCLLPRSELSPPPPPPAPQGQPSVSSSPFCDFLQPKSSPAPGPEPVDEETDSTEPETKTDASRELAEALAVMAPPLQVPAPLAAPKTCEPVSGSPLQTGVNLETGEAPAKGLEATPLSSGWNNLPNNLAPSQLNPAQSAPSGRTGTESRDGGTAAKQAIKADLPFDPKGGGVRLDDFSRTLLGDTQLTNKERFTTSSELPQPLSETSRSSAGPPLHALEQESTDPHGTTVAQLGRKMQTVFEQDKFTSLLAKGLKALATDASAKKDPAAGRLDQLTKAVLPQSSNSPLPQIENVNEVIAPRPVERGALNHLLSNIHEGVLSFRRLQSDSLEVRLLPDAATEIRLQFSMRDGQVEAALRCERGNSDLLTQHWPELRRALKDQGVFLLDPTAQGSNTHFQNDSRSGNQQPQAWAEPTEQNWPTVPFFRPSSPLKTNSSPARKATTRLLESWA